MHAKDLRSAPPRRWNVRIDGIPWLPRLIDKARAAQAGSLGAYLFGQSPMDRSCLRALGLGHRQFAALVATHATDEDLVAALAARDASALDRGRAWGSDLAQRHRLFLFVLDLDDGYMNGPLRPLKPLVNVLANSLTWTVKRIWPFRPAGPQA